MTKTSFYDNIISIALKKSVKKYTTWLAMRRMHKYKGENYSVHLLRDKNFKYLLKDKK